MELFTKERRAYRAKFYKTGKYKKIRAKFLKSNPLCTHCLNERKITLAQVLDHENPHWTSWKEFISGPFNPLCRKHHEIKTFFKDLPSIKKKQITKIKALEI